MVYIFFDEALYHKGLQAIGYFSRPAALYRSTSQRWGSAKALIGI